MDKDTGEVIELSEPGPFGSSLSKEAPVPWIFCGKHFDPVANLVYFGYRYYSPELKEWLTKDPLGQDLYRYCFGNPFTYRDPDGRFALVLPILELAWGAGLAVTAPIWGPAAIITATAATAAYAGAKMYQHMEARKDKEGKQKDGTPKTNTAQNDQFVDAVREIERKTGKKISDKQWNKLHDRISGKNYGYHDIVEEGCWLLNE